MEADELWTKLCGKNRWFVSMATYLNDLIGH